MKIVCIVLWGMQQISLKAWHALFFFTVIDVGLLLMSLLYGYDGVNVRRPCQFMQMNASLYADSTTLPSERRELY